MVYSSPASSQHPPSYSHESVAPLEPWPSFSALPSSPEESLPELAHSAPDILAGGGDDPFFGLNDESGWRVDWDDERVENENGMGMEVEGDCGSVVSDGGFGGFGTDVVGSTDNKEEVGDVGKNVKGLDDNKVEEVIVVKKEKPRRGRKRRYSPEEELRLFGPDAFKDLRGTTAAHSRKMTAREREIMLHKRRLRNRESAARSREKRGKTLAELSSDYEVLAERTKELVGIMGKYEKVLEENRRLVCENRELKEENWCLQLRSRQRKRNQDDSMSMLELRKNGFTEAVTP